MSNLWKPVLTLCATALLAGLVPGASASVLIGFEGVVADDELSTPVTPYTEAGFTITSSSRSENNWIAGKDYGVGGANTNGSAVFGFCSTESGNPCTRETVITLSGVSAFTLDSIDIARYVLGGAAGSLNLTGYLEGGGTVTASLGITDDAWTTRTLTGFTGLTSVDLIGHTTYAVAIDNLVLRSDVPEPATPALAGLALLGLAISCRRCRR